MVLISATAPESRSGLTVALITEDVYSVMTDRDTLGYVQRVGTVFVALSGDVLSHAVEVGQSLSLERAVRMVRFQ